MRTGSIGVKTGGIVITELGSVELQEVEVPELSSHEVVTRTLYSGISRGMVRHYTCGVYGDVGQGLTANHPSATGYQRCAVVEHGGSEVDQSRTGDLDDSRTVLPFRSASQGIRGAYWKRSSTGDVLRPWLANRWSVAT